MYEQVYFSQEINRMEQEQIERAAERRRFLREHADQIVPRRAGPFRRMLNRIVTGRADAAPRSARSATPPRSATPVARAGNLRAPKARTVDECVGAGCEPLAATAL